ncbi:carbohydrate-binding module family 14 protein [Nereida sp. MMG025]|uniref:carbohydrate-binding module family 14 protein n=1 Tax=Nereida sp. MMG025 TaxID=2909981 RepID=UPI001F15BC83|nr:carbohydrate-binding module family 14 protein [Nereida sp. MMG025]MCF6443392.1 carbohydrate-binding module family 14 protein [Nereida sp. MMG025]
MKMKTILAALALAVVPTFGFAMGCSDGHTAQMSCAEGTSWDADQGACVPSTTS